MKSEVLLDAEFDVAGTVRGVDLGIKLLQARKAEIIDEWHCSLACDRLERNTHGYDFIEFASMSGTRTRLLEHSRSYSVSSTPLTTSMSVGAILVAGIDPTADRQSRFAASLQALSNGRRQACGAMSWWIDFGPQPPWS